VPVLSRGRSGHGPFRRRRLHGTLSRFQRLKGLRGVKRITHLPLALAGLAVTLLASHRAYRALRTGYINYWPDTQSPNLKEFCAPATIPKTAIQIHGAKI